MHVHIWYKYCLNITEDEEYTAITVRLFKAPVGFIKSQILILTRCKFYKLAKGEMYYKDQNLDGIDLD